MPSLCTPMTMWNSTNGFSAPSQSAPTGDTPNLAASRGSAHTIIARPQSTNIRWMNTPDTTWSPVSIAISLPTARNSGPYGAGVSRQMFGTPRVSTWSTPSAEAGPSSYGSRPRAAISLCAR